MPTIRDALNIISKLTESERKDLIVLLKSNTLKPDGKIEELMTSHRFSNGRVCPCCGGTHVVRNGHRKDGTQRYICRACKKSFVITTNSIISGTHYDLETWERYVGCMTGGMSIRKSANVCGINVNTSFIWRHKILDALQNMANDVLLDGIVEVGEMDLPVSYKGNHKNSRSFSMNRAPKKRGSTHIDEAGEQIRIFCAVNRTGLSVARAMRVHKKKEKEHIYAFFENKMKKNAIVCTDKKDVYKRLSNNADLNVIKLNAGKTKKGIYSMRSINKYYSDLEQFLYGFKGVSTKFLNNYIIWHSFLNYAHETAEEKRKILLIFVITTLKSVQTRSISLRPPVPLLGE